MHSKHKKQRIAAWSVTALILVLSFVLFVMMPSSPMAEDLPDTTETSREVQVRQFDPGDITSEIRITGRVRAVERIDLFSEVQGVLTDGARPFRTGNRFEEGEVLVRLDDTDQALELNAQRSRFQSAMSSLIPTLKTDYPDNASAWADFVEDFDAESPLPELPEPADRQERFFLSANDIYSQYYTIRAMENRLEKFTLRAPFSGELREADAHPGALIQPNTRLGEFVGDVYELETFVSLKELEYIRTGDTIKLESAVSGLELEGRITRISRSVDPATQSFPVYAEIESPELRSGIYLQGQISGRTLSGVVEIPRNLLTRENTVMVIDDGIATHREVEPVFFNRSTVLVRGIEADDKVIELRAGTSTLAGTKVTPAED